MNYRASFLIIAQGYTRSLALMLDVLILNNFVGPHGETISALILHRQKQNLFSVSLVDRLQKSSMTLRLMFALLGKLLFLSYWMSIKLTASTKEIHPKGFGVMLRSKIPNQIMIWLLNAVAVKCLMKFYFYV